MSDNFEQARQFFVQGLAHYQAGRFEEAERDFAASLALLPGRPSTLTNLGAARLKLGKFQEAADLLEEALAQEPDNAEALGHRATALAELGQQEQALACVERALAVNPGLAPAWTLRGSLLKDLGRPDEAAAAYEQAIARGADPELNRYYLAALRGGEVPQAPPRQYVESLFDGYADGFEEHLVEVLNYRAPKVLVDELRRMQRRFDCALDLGCGTGLCGVLLRPLARSLHGVDLSGNMVERAAARGVYDALAQADVAQYLADTQQSYDLVLAADVFIYLGALEAVFAGVARVMRPGGVFCFSVEACDEGPDFALRPSLRYAHSSGYIRKLAEQYGFEIGATAGHSIREDQGIPIPGLFAWLIRR
ncbi:tetratricopeptide repeat protein [Caenimonas soli]|uniref:tetratricopeptide repeat protein n=1 Tax=Caenimonas soli TaxID=2735555 RepID=UPI00155456AB|nr:tetratricopeptide repeat protein [Caenimonas soli]NPC58436.1 tetratricopeptide repeat protein [Caenimonas soli]